MKIGPLYWPEGHYGCMKVNTKAIPQEVAINLFKYWFLSLTVTPGLNQAILGFTTPL